MTKVVSYKSLGIQQTYDIEVDHADHQFYLSNGTLTSNSAHSKSYTFITMQMAWLRTYYPLEYFCGVLTHGKVADLQTYVDDIKRQGFEILPVDINKSKEAHIIEGTAIRLAFNSVQGVGDKAAIKIVANQPYANFRDYLYRHGGAKTATVPLVKIGAFNCLEDNIAQLEKRYNIWIDEPKLKLKKNRNKFEAKYFATETNSHSLAKLVEYENELLGFSLVGSPFELFDRDKKIIELTPGCKLVDYDEFIESRATSACIPVLLKGYNERAQKNGKMFAFMKFGDVKGVEFEAPCFANIWQHISSKAIKGNVYLVEVNRKLDEPRNLVVGRPGWGHTEYSSKGYLLNLDDIEL